MRWNDNLFNEFTSRLDVRIPQLIVAWHLIKKHPFGIGLGQYRIHRQQEYAILASKNKIDPTSDRGEHVHCEPVENILEYGWFGVLIYFGVIAYILINANNSIFIAPIVTLLVGSLYYFPFRRPLTGGIFWILLGALSQHL